MRLPEFSTTAIGSLPHHNVDAALEFSLQLSIPFLPQIPIRNPWEFMIAQVLDGMPGIAVEKDGSVSLDADVWAGRMRNHPSFNDRLGNAFAAMDRPEAFEAFEPSASISSCWQPFLWELAEREVKLAKIQLAGPLTSQWVLRSRDGASVDKNPEISSQIYRLVMARALAMSRRLKISGIQPLLYIDEPALYGFTAADPKHALGLQELKLMIQALRKEGVLVGLHCCSNTDWANVLKLDLNVLSIDTRLSLDQLLSTAADQTEKFLKGGGRLSLGVIPTSGTSENDVTSLDVEELFAELLDTFNRGFKNRPDLVRRTLSQAIYTPACGLALQSTATAQATLSLLLEFQNFCESSLRT